VAAIRHSSGFSIGEALTPSDVEACRELFREYEKGLGVSLCFQDFDKELATLPGAYSRPRGRLLLARVAGAPAACAALRPQPGDAAEMKRLYVRPRFRGMGLGRALAEIIVDEARSLGYASVRLDTLPTMREAHGLYEAMGFREVAPYYENPVAGTLYLELTLKP